MPCAVVQFVHLVCEIGKIAETFATISVFFVEEKPPLKIVCDEEARVGLRSQIRQQRNTTSLVKPWELAIARRIGGFEWSYRPVLMRL
ncbi:Hypothetical protein NTJ_06962 [Nesidiocoris tenuis]|uniref:Uncharacterized protein n=1 Tax=Nesidiocoris tenuis TaxID=355587 RepID=A0ABN7APL4_9HEMI|nr:Hypothetical protein NTJ_06962 [Nesidiocoris tenuis]